MAAYFPDARVTSYEELIGSMTNHPKDRHVLAAAVAGRADILVTENLKDFPPAAVAHLGITVAGQDDFLSGLLELYPDAVLDALRRQASRYRREPRTVMALLNVLASPGQGCPEFARQCRTCCNSRRGRSDAGLRRAGVIPLLHRGFTDDMHRAVRSRSRTTNRRKMCYTSDIFSLCVSECT
jgi:hypothetical protein